MPSSTVRANASTLSSTCSFETESSTVIDEVRLGVVQQVVRHAGDAVERRADVGRVLDQEAVAHEAPLV